MWISPLKSAPKREQGEIAAAWASLRFESEPSWCSRRNQSLFSPSLDGLLPIESGSDFRAACKRGLQDTVWWRPSKAYTIFAGLNAHLPLWSKQACVGYASRLCPRWYRVSSVEVNRRSSHAQVLECCDQYIKGFDGRLLSPFSFFCISSPILLPSWRFSSPTSSFPTSSIEHGI
jgi:hypothetical protein